jgi:aspartyl-tRNA(Asn)/glutamyl-tRNA(Gln) amidotransferase subunit B
LNSFRAVERAMKHEAQRQYEEFGRSGQRLVEVSKATAGWDDARGVTVVQRRKEEASDYRYFPEPDLVPVVADEAWIDRVRATMGELPAAARARLQAYYGLSAYDAGVITTQGRAFTRYFEEVVGAGGEPKDASNWMTNQVLQTLNERKIGIGDFPLLAGTLADLLKQVKSSGLNMQRAREVYARMLESGVAAAKAIEELGYKPVADEGQLREIVRRAIAGNPKAVADYKKGKIKAADAIKGAVMRETKGMARTDLVQQLLLQELAEA